MPPPAILGPNGRPLADRRAPAPRVVLRGRYDAAETTNETAKHWAMADGLSARMANSPDVRRKLRERARYECANNSICKGIVETLANDVIGTGPRLQMCTARRRRESSASRPRSRNGRPPSGWPRSSARTASRAPSTARRSRS
jgi:hypothetical protein